MAHLASDVLSNLIEHMIILGVKPSASMKTANSLKEISSASSIEFAVKDIYPKDSASKGFFQFLHFWCFSDGLKVFDLNGKLFSFQNIDSWEYCPPSPTDSTNHPITVAAAKSILEDVSFSHFVTTDENSMRHYCTSLQVNELRRIQVKQGNSIQVKRVIFPKAYVLTSSENVMKAQKHILSFLYSRVLLPCLSTITSGTVGSNRSIRYSGEVVRNFEKYSNNYGYREAQKSIQNFDTTSKTEDQLTVREEYVISFLLSLLSQTIHKSSAICSSKHFSVSLGGKEIVRMMNASRSSFFEIENISFTSVIKKVSAESLVNLFEAIILEKQIVIFSQNPSEIVHLCEALFAFIRPLVWNCLYVPFLPAQMLETLHTMVPYIVGVHRSNKNQVLQSIESENKLFYDLDSDFVIKDGQSIPQSIKSWLIEEVSSCLMSAKETNSSSNNNNSHELRAILHLKKTFLHFMISIINNYMPFLLQTGDLDNQKSMNVEIFDFKGYLRLIDPKKNAFFTDFSQKTMMFRQFLEHSSKIFQSNSLFKKDTLQITDASSSISPPSFPFLVAFIKEITRIQSYMNLNSPLHSQIVNVNLLNHPDMLSSLSLEHTVQINNYLSDITKVYTYETKSDLLKYLTYISKEFQQPISTPVFIDQQSQQLITITGLPDQFDHKIPILDLNQLQNKADKRISCPSVPVTKHAHTLLIQDEFDNPIQRSISPPMLLKYSSALLDSHNLPPPQRLVKHYSENELIMQLPASSRMLPSSSTIFVPTPNNSQQQQQALSFLPNQQINSITSSNFVPDHPIKVIDSLRLHNQDNQYQSERQPRDRWVSVTSTSSTTAISQNPSQSRKRRIFEDSSQSPHRQQNQQKPRQQLINLQNCITPQSRCYKKSKTEVSLDEMTTENYFLHSKIIEDFKGEEDVADDDDDGQTQKIDYQRHIPSTSVLSQRNLHYHTTHNNNNKQICQNYNPDKSISSPNRSDIIPEENQITDNIPAFFEGDVEMKNIVTLNIDQITHSHMFYRGQQKTIASSVASSALLDENQNGFNPEATHHIQNHFFGLKQQQQHRQHHLLKASTSAEQVPQPSVLHGLFPFSHTYLQTEDAVENSESISYIKQQHLLTQGAETEISARQANLGSSSSAQLEHSSRLQSKSSIESTLGKQINGYFSQPNYNFISKANAKNTGAVQRTKISLFNKTESTARDSSNGAEKRDIIQYNLSEKETARIPDDNSHLKQYFAYNPTIQIANQPMTSERSFSNSSSRTPVVLSKRVSGIFSSVVSQPPPLQAAISKERDDFGQKAARAPLDSLNLLQQRREEYSLPNQKTYNHVVNQQARQLTPTASSTQTQKLGPPSSVVPQKKPAIKIFAGKTGQNPQYPTKAGEEYGIEKEPIQSQRAESNQQEVPFCQIDLISKRGPTSITSYSSPKSMAMQPIPMKNASKPQPIEKKQSKIEIFSNSRHAKTNSKSGRITTAVTTVSAAPNAQQNQPKSTPLAFNKENSRAFKQIF